MAVEMIGGPRLCEPPLATGLGRFTGVARVDAVGFGFDDVYARLRKLEQQPAK